jgi:hypothetical protein
MTAKPAIALVSLLVTSGMIAGCASGTGPAVPASTVLTCGTVVDTTAYHGGPLTAGLAIAFLTDIQLTDGAANIPRGTPSSADTSTLDAAAAELIGYSGSELSDDAAAFALAEEYYNPDGPIDTSYGRRLDNDILALERDCPDGMKLGGQWRNARS